jgi:hypothetical protein
MGVDFLAMVARFENPTTERLFIDSAIALMEEEAAEVRRRLQK